MQESNDRPSFFVECNRQIGDAIKDASSNWGKLPPDLLADMLTAVDIMTHSKLVDVSDNRFPFLNGDRIGGLELEAYVHTVAGVRRWNHAGRPVFRLSPGLTYALLRTEPLDDKEIRFPVEAFSISLPEGEWIEMTSTGVSGPPPTWIQWGKEILFASSLPMFDEQIRLGRMYTIVGNAHTERVRGTRTELFDSEVAELVEIAKLATKAPWASISSQDLSPQTKDGETETATVTLRLQDDILESISYAPLILRLAKNLSTYLAMRPQDWPLPSRRSTSSKKTKKRRMVDRFNENRRNWFVGKEIELPEHLIRNTKRASRSTPGVRQGLSQRIYVPGHFRRQAHGKGWKEHKTIWIQPFYKGPEGIAIAEKRYHAKTLAEAGLTND